MLWTITCRRLRRDKRGVSNVIVVALSLVIILAIVSNIVLWNYEMTQLDWEKMKENIVITNVESGIFSSWFVAQSEYTVTLGSRTSGSYIDTQAVGGGYESFTESEEGIGSITLIDAESFEGVWPPAGWTKTGNWAQESNYVYSGKFSADFEGDELSGELTSPIMNCLDTDEIYVDFWWYDRGLDNDDFILEYYNGNTWNTHQDLNQLESGNGWHHYTETLTDSQYFVSDFQIRWWANTVWNGERACVDVVTVTKNSNASACYFDLNGSFVINLDEYPLEDIQTFEIQLRFKTDSTAEKWYLKAYNWITHTYSNVGFNCTEGYTPTMGWDYYAVTATEGWQNYVRDDGTVSVKLVNEGTDNDATTVAIDFLGVRAKNYGTQFTFKNTGALTVHLVSLWINNSTDHQHYDINVLVNSADTKIYLREDVSLPTGGYTIKVVTERGNIAVYSGS
jgi:hypothetical protein